MGLILLVALPALYWFLNRFRGTQKAGGPIVGAITGVIVFLFTGQPILAAGVAIAYALGEAPGWGRWIKLFNKDYSQETYMSSHREPDRGKVIHKIANKLSPEKKDYKKYALTAMALRGLLWSVPVGLVGTYLEGPVWLLVSLLGALQGVCCRLAASWNFGPPYWTRQENLTGILWGVMLALWIGFGAKI